MKNAVAICRKNCRSVNHVTSFGEMTSLAFFPYHSKSELAGRLMLVAEKSVPVRSGGEYQELVLVSLDVSRKNAILYLEMTLVVAFFRVCWSTDALQQRSLDQCALKSWSNSLKMKILVEVGSPELAGRLMLYSRMSGPVRSEEVDPAMSEFNWSTDALQQRSRSRKL